MRGVKSENLLQNLDHYLENTPREKILKDWEAVSVFDEITVKELQTKIITEKRKECERLEEQLKDLKNKAKFVEFAYSRLLNVYTESENIDYMQGLKAFINILNK